VGLACIAISIIYVGSWYSLQSSSQNFDSRGAQLCGDSVKCGERERENVENVRVRIANIQLTTSVELGCKVLKKFYVFLQPSSTLVVRSGGV
jgi:hypothetical protein